MNKFIFLSAAPLCMAICGCNHSASGILSNALGSHRANPNITIPRIPSTSTGADYFQAFDDNIGKVDIPTDAPSVALQLIRAEHEVYRCLATYSFSSRRKRALLREIEHTFSECKRTVAGSQKAVDGALANDWRKIEEFVRAKCAEVLMWLLLDDDNIHAAWDALMEAQNAAYRAARWLSDFEPAQHLDDHL
ncbi:MAG TPA: hypothetical protein VII69_14705, partial [Candidatus Eremiobacteraceae bacterium]